GGLRAGAENGAGRDQHSQPHPGCFRASRGDGRSCSAGEPLYVSDRPCGAAPAGRASLLTFLIVGAGPTGVELAGAIAELARNGLAKDFRNFDPASARILLVQAGPRVLPQFNERLSAFARTSLEALGVEVRVDSRVEGIDAE